MIPLDAKVYEVLSLAMRYVFVFYGVMIVWRAFSWLRKDRRIKHKRLKQLPDAGTIGILTVIEGSKHLKPGTVLPVPHEGVLGYFRTCDVVVPVDEVATLHLDFTFVDGKGLFIYPRRGCEAIVDGVTLTSRQESNRHPMQHGSMLEIGQAVLQLGVFAGLNVQETYYAPAAPGEAFPADHAYSPAEPGEIPPYQSWPPQNQPNSPYPPSPYEQPTNLQPVNPPVQPPYGRFPYAPPYQQPIPWQGGDDNAP